MQNKFILSTILPAIYWTNLLLSLFMLLGAHNLPGGGFIGGLILSVYPIIIFVHTGQLIHQDKALFTGVIFYILHSLFIMQNGEYFFFAHTTFGISESIIFDLSIYLIVYGTLIQAINLLKTITEN